MRFWRGPRETVGGAKGATPWVPSQGSLRSLIIFSQVIYKRKPNDPKPKNKLAYFGRTLDLDCWKKDNETAASYRVTLLPVRVYIALEKLVFRRTNKKTMYIPRKTYFLVEELEKKAVVEPAPAVWHNLQFGARPPAVSKYQRIKKCHFCISVFLWSCISLFALCLVQLAFWLSDHEQSGNINGSKIYSTGKSLAKNQGKSKTLRWKESYNKQKTQLKLSPINWK